MDRNDHNRTLALAALFQCASLVKDLAWRGSCDEYEFEILIGSLFAFDAETPEDVYRGASSLRPGLERVHSQLQNGGKPPDMEITRYAVGLIFLDASCKNARTCCRNWATGCRVPNGRWTISPSRTRA